MNETQKDISLAFGLVLLLSLTASELTSIELQKPAHDPATATQIGTQPATSSETPTAYKGTFLYFTKPG